MESVGRASGVAALAAAGAAQSNVVPIVSSNAQAHELLGSAVAVDGERVAVGVPREGDWTVSTGAVDVHLDLGGAWDHEARLRASDGAPGDYFGASLALSGERIVVGAPQHDAAGAQSGAAYVFLRVDGEWEQEAKLLAADAGEGGQFGASVDMESDVLIVGAPQQVSSQLHSGAAYVFRRGADGWIQEQKLWYPSLTEWADYGTSVSISGGRVAVGAPKQESTSLASGLVHLLRNEGGGWFTEDELVGSLPVYDSTFGRSVDLRGEELVVGSRGEAAYVYALEPEGWRERQVLMTVDHEESYPLRFGHAVALGDGVLLVAAGNGDAQHVFAGAVYVFRHDGVEWVEDHRLESPNAQVGAQFGHAVAADGRRALIGAPYEMIGGQHDSGRAYVFELAFPVEELCFGDGSQGACPCGNEGAGGHGCGNTAWPDGARLSHSGGTPGLAGNGLTLALQHSLPFQPGVLLRSSQLLNGGAGAPFGDGLRCVGGAVERLQVALTGRFGEASLQLAPFDPARDEAGDAVYLQWWFRDPEALVCGLGFNTSNAVRATLRP